MTALRRAFRSALVALAMKSPTRRSASAWARPVRRDTSRARYAPSSGADPSPGCGQRDGSGFGPAIGRLGIGRSRPIGAQQAIEIVGDHRFGGRRGRRADAGQRAREGGARGERRGQRSQCDGEPPDEQAVNAVPELGLARARTRVARSQAPGDVAADAEADHGRQQHEEARQKGQRDGRVAPGRRGGGDRQPEAGPNVSSTKVRAAAASAPATAGLQESAGVAIAGVADPAGTGTLSASVILRSSSPGRASTKPEEGQDRQDHDDQADEIDQLVHRSLME